MSGKRLSVYVLIKLLKYVTCGYVSNNQCKLSLYRKLTGVDPEKIELGEAIRSVISYPSIAGKFNGIMPELKSLGYCSVQVTDEGFQFIKKEGVCFIHF